MYDFKFYQACMVANATSLVFLWVWGGTFGFQVVFGVESGMFTFHLDIPLSIQVFFFSSSSRTGIQSKEFPIASHFYPIRFGKCCPPFTKIFCKAQDESYDEPKTYGYHEMYEGYGPYAYLWCKVPLKDL
jgi:hypothetical protein